MEVFGGKPGHVDGCTGWCFLSSCIVVAQPIFSDAQVCPLHEVMDILCKHHSVGRKVDGNPNPLVRGKKSKVGLDHRHGPAWILFVDEIQIFGKMDTCWFEKMARKPNWTAGIHTYIYIYIYLWVFKLVASIEEESNCIPYLLFLGSCPTPRTYLSLFHFVSFMTFRLIWVDNW